MDTLYTVGDNNTHSKTKSVHFLGRMNSATKIHLTALVWPSNSTAQWTFAALDPIVSNIP